MWDPAGVVFYEHLVDEPATRAAIPQWLKPEVYDQVRGLFHSRLSAEEFAGLEQSYRAQHKDAP